MMKKRWAVSLAAVMILGLTACSGGGTTGGTNASASTDSGQTQEEKTEAGSSEKEYIQSRLYLAQLLNIACFPLVTYHILWFYVVVNQGLVSLVACLSLKSIK